MKRIILFLLPCVLIMLSCKKQVGTNALGKNIQRLEYAELFTVNEYDNYSVLKLINPWDTTQILTTYVLVDRDIELPDSLPNGILVRVPIQSAVVYSSINCSALDEIGKLDIVKGACETTYIKSPHVRKQVDAGKIIDVGEAKNPDVEKILDIDPEVIFASPIDGQGFGQVERTKIPIIQTIDYTEASPLARAEWIKFYSFFAGNRYKADSIFDQTKTNYNQIKDQVITADFLPTVFLDLKYQASWNVAGGRSYIARMLEDAGARYVWGDDTSSKYLPLSFETVLDKAGDANIWLIKYYSSSDMTYQTLKREYVPYSYFKAFKDRNIYGCNTMSKTYYEDMPIHPDYVLKNMAAIFHPELFPDYIPEYYSKLKE